MTTMAKAFKLPFLANALLRFLLAGTLLTSFFFAGIEILANTDAFYRWRFRASGVSESTGIASADLDTVIDEIQALLAGKKTDFHLTVPVDGQEVQIFGDSESFHMMEVASLFATFRQTFSRTYIGVVIYLFLLRGNGMFHELKRAAIRAACGLAVLGIACALLFERAFVYMHLLLFSNDGWLFPPNSYLIRILDESFFSTFAMFAALIALVLLAGLAWASHTLAGRTAKSGSQA